MVSIVVTAYFAICFAAAGYILLLLAHEDSLESPDWQRLKQRVGSFNFWRWAAFGGTIMVTLFAWAPVVLASAPLIAFSCYRERRFWVRFARRFREAILKPIPFEHFPESARDYIERLESQVYSLRFRKVGDFLYKDEPLLGQVRLYLSSDGLMILSVGHHGGDLSYSLSSLLADGSVVETAVVAHLFLPEWPAEVTEYMVQMFASPEGESVAEIVERHRELLVQSADKNRSVPFVVQAQQVCDCLRYENRKYAAQLYSAGKLDDQPPSPVWPLQGVPSTATV